MIGTNSPPQLPSLLIHRQAMSAPDTISTHAIASVPSTSATGSAAVEIQRLVDRLTQNFDRHITPENTNNMQAMILDRAQKLHEMGQTPDSFEAAMTKATRLDRIATAAIGAVRAIPFGSASVLLDTVPDITKKLNPAEAGAVAGGISGALDSFGTSIMDRTTENRLWLQAPEDKLEEVMVEPLKKIQRTPAQKSFDAGVAIQTYTARNVVRMAASAGITAWKGPEIAKRCDTAIAGVGGLIANAAFASQLYQNNLKNKIAGPEMLLARTDWQEQYKDLLTTPSYPILKGGQALCSMALDSATRSFESLGKLAQASNLAKIGVLSGGFALAGPLRELGRNSVVAPVAVTAVDHAVNTAVSAAVFAVWTTADVYVGPKADTCAKFIQEEVPKASEKAVQVIGEQAGALAGIIGTAAESGANSVSTAMNKLMPRRRTPPVGGSAEEV